MVELWQVKSLNYRREKKFRVGRGKGCGLGKTCGRGEKGQKSRAGGWKLPLVFEGGTMPFYRRLPKKRGFSNRRFKKVYAIVNVDDLNIFDDNTTVTTDILLEYNIIKKRLDGTKILGRGDLNKKLIVKADAFSKLAKEKIISAGGEAILCSE